RSAVVNSKTGKLIGVKTLSDDESQEVIIVSGQGQTIRLGLKNIPLLGRATQGVRIMRLNDGDEVVSLALVDAVVEEEGEGPEEEI
ncbi:MAG TPA: DNA gyrase C-terminal beta-propeller domain-containing protein, partial [Candidatus Saccharimonadales bacterium]|nr:DNA gyrase C-terminal beta-propeller domain-containing protein [Candidatus Saccharimonadales bacterium]